MLPPGSSPFPGRKKTEAKKLYQKACDGGFMDGCSNLGSLEYQAGNKAEAKKAYKKAWDGGTMEVAQD